WKPYTGIGPSAHSYDGNKQRRWNISNNVRYAELAEAGNVLYEEENLSEKEQYNEYIMTGLRRTEGINLETVNTRFGNEFAAYLLTELEQVDSGLYTRKDKTIRLTREGKLLADGIASSLFRAIND